MYILINDLIIASGALWFAGLIEFSKWRCRVWGRHFKTWNMLLTRIRLASLFWNLVKQYRSDQTLFAQRKCVAAPQNQQNDLCAQRRLRPAWASAQSDQSSLCAQWEVKDPRFLHAESEDSDPTGHPLIWVFAGRTRIILLVLSCCCWNVNN